MGYGSKRHINWFYEYLEKNNYNVNELKNQINDIMVKTFLSTQAHLTHN